MSAPQTTDTASMQVKVLKGVGPKRTEQLAKLGIETVRDLVFHLPFRYDDQTRVTPIAWCNRGTAVLVCGEIKTIAADGTGDLVCAIADDSGWMRMRLKHWTHAGRDAIARSERIACFGTARWGRDGTEMTHPEFTLLQPGDRVPERERLTPVYRKTAGLGAKDLAKLVEKALALIDHDPGLADLVDAETARSHRLGPLRATLRYIHRPPRGVSAEAMSDDAHPARRRLAFEELMALHIAVRTLRRALDTRRGVAVGEKTALRDRLRKRLDFTLTKSQNRSLESIADDLRRDTPMHRLLQGDVGSGKTVVAALAACDVIDAGAQVAMMAPTELLAEQHERTLGAWLEPLGVRIAWLSGSLSKGRADAVRAGIANGSVDLAIGTHALISESVTFARLGFVVIDEQHRFGVHQRMTLGHAGAQPDAEEQSDWLAGPRHTDSNEEHPHQLVMTATPIPRTLALTGYADLDHSVINELPPGRKPIATAVMSRERVTALTKRIRTHLDEGSALQAYWVCPTIEESASEAAAVTRRHAALTTALDPHQVGLVHGRMSTEERRSAMGQFSEGATRVLVATTVIEVGVDVPQASIMIIESAERLGLAQLHQLRGRVGRGSERGYCVLAYDTEVSAKAKARLHAMQSTTDGFRIAEHDLSIRGPGELLGAEQSGLAAMRFADLARDADIIAPSRWAADRMMHEQPERAQALARRWLGARVAYGQA